MGVLVPAVGAIVAVASVGGQVEPLGVLFAGLSSGLSFSCSLGSSLCGWGLGFPCFVQLNNVPYRSVYVLFPYFYPCRMSAERDFSCSVLFSGRLVG